MGTRCTGSFEVTSWDESSFDERAGTSRLTRASVTKTYTGDVDGESVTEWLMAYAGDAATFVGLERIRGTVAGRQGTLVLQHVGTFEGGAAKAALSVVAGAGTDGLAGAAGRGDFLADPSGSVSLDLTFE